MTVMYLFDIRIQKDQPVFLVLKKVFGLGISTAKSICIRNGIRDIDLYSSIYSTPLQLTLEKYIKNNYKIGLELKRIILHNIKQKISLNSYKGFRHLSFLPVNGQRTHTNAKTSKKRRKKGALK